jgi:hypothetical protein
MDVPRFVETAVRIGVPKEWYDGARSAGPLATFDGTDEWVPHPYRDGVALIGDAASTSDPTWGQGMSLTLRDLRLLRDRLLADEDWDAAGHAYAKEHDRCYRETHTCDNWYTDIFLDVGPAADARRARALPLIAEDLTRLPERRSAGGARRRNAPNRFWRRRSRLNGRARLHAHGRLRALMIANGAVLRWECSRPPVRVPPRPDRARPSVGESTCRFPEPSAPAPPTSATS